MKETYPVEYGKKTWKALTEIERFGYEMPEILRDFVDFVLNALLSLTDNMKYAHIQDLLAENRLTGRYEDRYMQIVAKYKENKTRPLGERPADFFAEAWKWLQIETNQTQKDVLGHLYESQISLGRQGQFFTPHNIVRAIVAMLGANDGETVHEPACGSGRMIIVAAQENPNRYFVGIDVSPLLARMCAINMWLFDLNAEIWQGNTLSMEMSYVWQIRKGGWIWESKVIDENGRTDGTVELWLAEARKNHPPLPEEEQQALREESEKWQRILTFVREMESQFQISSQSTEEQLGAENSTVEMQPDETVDKAPSGIVFEIWDIKEYPTSEVPTETKKPASRKKRRTTGEKVVQQSLFNLDETET